MKALRRRRRWRLLYAIDPVCHRSRFDRRLRCRLWRCRWLLLLLLLLLLLELLHLGHLLLLQLMLVLLSPHLLQHRLEPRFDLGEFGRGFDGEALVHQSLAFLDRTQRRQLLSQ